MSSASYKSQKEAFVSDLTGGSITEINRVTALAPVAVFVWSILQARQSVFVEYRFLAFAIDFLLNVGAILLATTLYSDTPIVLSALLLSPALLTYFLPSHILKRGSPQSWAKRNKGKVEPLDDLPMKPFLTTYRGCMMVITCLAILAVDFRIFPRRFAKVENWGTSLMDLGVGSFVFSAGLVAARPILKEQDNPTKPTRALAARLYASMRHTLPLLVLGFVRLWSVKGLDYAEHVTEYGVHWNFFFTLALLPPFVALFQSAFELIPSYAMLSILLGCVYQVLLEATDLKAYILTAPRVDLLSKNREGLFSFFGYLAIFLAGQATGMYVIPRKVQRQGSSDGQRQRIRLLVTMGIWSTIWILLYQLSTNYPYGLALNVSRRLANLPYFLWVTAFNCAQLSAFCVVETLFFPAFHRALDREQERRAYDHATSRILAAYNRNGLAVFLFANLATGLVNMSMPTLYMGEIASMAVLVGYAATITGGAVLLDMYNISIKM